MDKIFDQYPHPSRQAVADWFKAARRIEGRPVADAITYAESHKGSWAVVAGHPELSVRLQKGRWWVQVERPTPDKDIAPGRF